MYFVNLRGLVSRPGIKPCMIQYCMLSLVYLPYFVHCTYSIHIPFSATHRQNCVLHNMIIVKFQRYGTVFKLFCCDLQVIAVADPKKYQRERLQTLCNIADDMVFQGTVLL